MFFPIITSALALHYGQSTAVAAGLGAAAHFFAGKKEAQKRVHFGARTAEQPKIVAYLSKSCGYCTEAVALMDKYNTNCIERRYGQSHTDEGVEIKGVPFFTVGGKPFTPPGSREQWIQSLENCSRV